MTTIWLPDVCCDDIATQGMCHLAYGENQSDVTEIISLCSWHQAMCDGLTPQQAGDTILAANRSLSELRESVRLEIQANTTIVDKEFNILEVPTPDFTVAADGTVELIMPTEVVEQVTQLSKRGTPMVVDTIKHPIVLDAKAMDSISAMTSAVTTKEAIMPVMGVVNG